ncbi:transposable element Tc1 transposase [Trichonephila clavipes]|nr:transposable element Tc1 transposase [Trichonephila clavipes]
MQGLAYRNERIAVEGDCPSILAGLKAIYCIYEPQTLSRIQKRHGGGRVRSTTPADDRYIVLSTKRNRRATAQQVANQFLAASGKQISRKTVARRLRGGGLYARRPVVCVSLTRQHRTTRLQWCREHHNWTEQDWVCVLFSDESRFSLSSDCRRQLILRESGTAYRPENIQEKDRYPTCSIMVWAGIMINGRTRLHVVANGTMTGQRYIDEVLLPHVWLFRGAVDSYGIQRLVWPARSPYLNPIENVWDALGRQVAGRNYPPTNKNTTNKNTLIRALTEEWDKLPQQLLDNVVQSMAINPCKIWPALSSSASWLDIEDFFIGVIFIHGTDKSCNFFCRCNTRLHSFVANTAVFSVSDDPCVVGHQVSYDNAFLGSLLPTITLSEYIPTKSLSFTKRKATCSSPYYAT